MQTTEQFISQMAVIWDGGPDYDTCHDAIVMARRAGAEQLYSSRFGVEPGYVFAFADGYVMIGTNGAWVRQVRRRRK